MKNLILGAIIGGLTVGYVNGKIAINIDINTIKPAA